MRGTLLLWGLVGCAPAPDTAPYVPSPSPIEGEAAPPGNVLVVLVDDVGTEQIARYGEGANPVNLPTLDRIADRGVLFRNAWATPVCSPTRAALLTGLHGHHNGVGNVVFLWSEPENQLDAAHVTIPNVLDDAPDPWQTAALGKWHLATEEGGGPHHPQRTGFDTFRGPLGNPSESLTGLGVDYNRWEKVEDGEVAMSDDYLTTDTANDAVEMVQTLEPPWFVYLAFNAPHFPLHEPPKDLYDLEAFNSDGLDVGRLAYKAMLSAVDTELGRVLDAIPADQVDNTTIIWLSDNGTEGDLIDAPYAAAHSKKSMYEGGVNVPMVISGPHVTDPGSESDALVHVVDILPTVADIARVPERERPAVDGHSLLPVLEDPGASVRELMFTERFEYDTSPTWANRTVRNADFKLIERLDNGQLTFERFFDLRGQPAEQAPLSETERNAAQQASYDVLRTALDGWN